jgi:tetratricopeptide (TPR) repeat protein
MKGTANPCRLGVAALVVTLLSGSVHAQDPLSAAKELYASAAYDEALSALERLRAEASPALALEVDQYRAFCLFALGRTREAEAVAENVVRANPLVELQTADTSPRIVALFADLQKRLLPTLIRERYRTARASMDEGDTAAAQAELVLVQRMLAKAKSVGAWDDALADITVLVDGFLELNRAGERRAAATPPPPTPAEPGPAASPVAAAAAPPSAPPAASPVPRETTAVAAPTPASVAPAEPPAAVSAGGAVARTVIYSALDSQVTGPVALRQEIPKVPAHLAPAIRASKRIGIIEVTIDERGRVDTALIRESVDPVFDGMVLTAAKAWQYQPARLQGTPVRYLKRIAIALR